MNVYQVVSEELLERIPVLDYGEGPLEPYRIAEMVVAKSPSQARYLAWKSDRSFEASIAEMPRFSAKLVLKNLDCEPGVTNGFDHLWDS